MAEFADIASAILAASERATATRKNMALLQDGDTIRVIRERYLKGRPAMVIIRPERKWPPLISIEAARGTALKRARLKTPSRQRGRPMGIREIRNGALVQYEVRVVTTKNRSTMREIVYPDGSVKVLQGGAP